MMRQASLGLSRSRQLCQRMESCRGFRIFAANLKGDCKKLEESQSAGIICRKPDLRSKKIPPYRYGYCREPDKPMLMSCPPKTKKRGKGPCCHEEVSQKKGGCKVNK